MNTVESLKAKLKKHLADRPQFKNIASMTPDEYASYSKTLTKWIADKGEIEMSIVEAENPSLGKGLDWRDERFVGERLAF
jgi:hypothetical protein